MSPEKIECWRPSGWFLLRGSTLSFLIGAVIGALQELGGRHFDAVNLVWGGLVGLFIFLVVSGLLSVIRIEALGGLRKAASLAGILFVGGVVAWLAVLGLGIIAGVARLPISWSDVITSLGISGLLAILVGSGFYVYEDTRQRMLQSVSRLKEAEYAEKELELAASIQRRLLPATELSGDGYRIAARNLPAHYVAGDFFDVFSLPDGAVGLVVADVAGKGIGASLIMASVKAVLPLLAAQRSAEETLAALNKKLCEELETRQFVALCYARYQPTSGKLVLVNAGLPDPYLLRPGLVPEALSVPGPRLPLGLRPDEAYRAMPAALAPAEGLLFLTDGLPEALAGGGEPLGYDAMKDLIPPLGPEPAVWLDTFLEHLGQATSTERTDDWTALLLERLVPAKQ